MAETSDFLKQAFLDPVGTFGNPEKVEGDVRLSQNDKLTILKLWAHDCELLEIAEEENMPGSCDIEMTKRILDCIHRLTHTA